MSYKKTTLIVFLISIAGLLFSGYLSYLELFIPQGCVVSPVSCGTSGFTIADLPACVYGFFMYVSIFLITGFALLNNKNKKEND